MSREVDPVEQEEFTFLELDGGNLELLKSLAQPFEKPEIKPPYCPHLALATDDMNATVQLIHATGLAAHQRTAENRRQSDVVVHCRSG